MREGKGGPVLGATTQIFRPQTAVQLKNCMKRIPHPLSLSPPDETASMSSFKGKKRAIDADAAPAAATAAPTASASEPAIALAKGGKSHFPSGGDDRLIIRNLPHGTTQASLVEHLSSLPSTSSAASASGAASARITDVKLLHKSDGSFRRFAFVGFQSAAQAARVKEYFDGSYLGTSKIRIEFAQVPSAVGSDEARKRGKNSNTNSNAEQNGSASSTAQASSKKRKLQASDAAGPADSASATADSQRKAKAAAKGRDVTFEEFMAVMAPKSKRKTWANEDGVSLAEAQATAAAATGAADSDDDEDVQDLTGAAPGVSTAAMDKAKRREEKRKRKAEKAAAKAAKEAASDAEAGDGSGDEKPEDTEMTDAEYLASRMRKNVGQDFEKALEEGDASSSYDSDEGDEGEGEGDDSVQDAAVAAKALAAVRAEERAAKRREEALRKEQEDVDLIMQTGRLMVRNLPFTATEDDLQTWAQTWGEVRYVSLFAFSLRARAPDPR